MEKWLISPIRLEPGRTLLGLLEPRATEEAPETLAFSYSVRGADALLVLEQSETDAELEDNLHRIKAVCASAEIPVIGGGRVKRLEDVKKLLYAGCSQALVPVRTKEEVVLLAEAALRFGREKLIARTDAPEDFQAFRTEIEANAGAIACFSSAAAELAQNASLPVLCGCTRENDPEELLSHGGVFAVAGDVFADPGDRDLLDWKASLNRKGVPVRTHESPVSWAELKKNSDGMVPVIVQDYRTDEVLMLAYMNEEAFGETLRTGLMTYWSRSRNELWRKGATSGHYQFLKSLRLDCDSDTLLAKVSQIGAACHTGNRSCFFRELVRTDCDDTNPLRVFQEVYGVIADRKTHPKEGSYTNYLFDKGIDKILKKVGEECTELVIAAKNPDPEEIKYEMSDLLYHAMVLMVEKGITWEDVTGELARR